MTIKAIHKTLDRVIDLQFNSLSKSMTETLNQHRKTPNYIYRKGYNVLKRDISEIGLNSYYSIVESINKSLDEVDELIRDEAPEVKYKRSVLNDIKEDVGSVILNKINLMADQLLRIARRDQVLLRREASLQGIPLKKASILFDNPVYYFRDKSGRKWSTDSYVRMVVNSCIYRTARELVVEKAIASGKEGSLYIRENDEKLEFSEYENNKMFHPNSKKLLYIRG